VHCHTAEHGTIRSVPVILFLAAAAILGCVVLAALGMGGEMATFPSDSAPLRMDEVSAADVALLRPPLALWGYNVPATEEALGVIARAVTARDTEIATLRAELADMQARWGAGDGTGSSHSAPPGQLRAPAPGPSDVSTAAHDEVAAWPAPPEQGPGD
jgi:hypothetical protein